jgi:hypothetical protein
LFDFSLHGQQAMAAQGVDPVLLGNQLSQKLIEWQLVAKDASELGSLQVMNRLRKAGWEEWMSAQGPAKGLWASKRASVRQMIQTYRQALDSVSGPYRLLEPQVFPQPISTWSGFAWDDLPSNCAAVGLKLYNHALAHDRPLLGQRLDRHL